MATTPKKKPRKKKSNAGRHTVMTQSVVDKLEQAFSMGCPDIEACLYAGINRATLYLYQKKHPEFIDRKEMLKKLPTMKARKTVHDDLNNSGTAKWYLEKKEKKEFSSHNSTDMNLDGDLEITISYEGDEDA